MMKERHARSEAEEERVLMDDKGAIETPAKKSQSFLSACDSKMPGDDAI